VIYWGNVPKRFLALLGPKVSVNICLLTLAGTMQTGSGFDKGNPPSVALYLICPTATSSRKLHLSNPTSKMPGILRELLT
jgi:hypothetical protein